MRTDFIPIVFGFVGGSIVLGYAIYSSKKGVITLKSGTYDRIANPGMFKWGVIFSAFLGAAFISASIYQLYRYLVE